MGSSCERSFESFRINLGTGISLAIGLSLRASSFRFGNFGEGNCIALIDCCSCFSIDALGDTEGDGSTVRLLRFGRGTSRRLKSIFVAILELSVDGARSMSIGFGLFSGAGSDFCSRIGTSIVSCAIRRLEARSGRSNLAALERIVGVGMLSVLRSCSKLLSAKAVLMDSRATSNCNLVDSVSFLISAGKSEACWLSVSIGFK